MATWRNYETPTSSAAPSGYSKFQTAYLDTTTKLIESFTSGDIKVDKFLKSDYTDIRYIKEFTIPTQMVAMDLYEYDVWSSDNATTYATRTLTASDKYVQPKVVYVPSCQAWFLTTGAIGGAIWRSVDRATWTEVTALPNYQGGATDIIGGAANEAAMFVYGTTEYFTTTDGGLTWLSQTCPKSSGVTWGAFYIGGNFWVGYEKSPYTYSYFGKITSLSNSAIATEYYMANPAIGRPGVQKIIYLEESNQWLTAMAKTPGGWCVHTITAEPTANGWTGTHVASGSSLFYTDQFNLAGTSPTNWVIHSPGTGGVGEGERVIHSSGSDLAVAVPTAVYDRDDSLWIFTVRSQFGGVSSHSTSTFATSAAVTLTGLTLTAELKIYAR